MKKYSILLIAILIITGCSKLKTPPAISERNQWIESFKDSIDFYSKQAERINKDLLECNDRMARLLDNFEHISNPREVTGYYILKGWKSKLPFTHTAIYARVNENENIELIATLAGGTFTSISVTNGEEEISSQSVPYDQAMNYRHANYNTVCFIGNKSDSVAEFINRHQDSRLSLLFKGGGKNNNFVIPEDEKRMISQTWELREMQIRQQQLQKELWINSRKIDTYRRMLERKDSLN